MSLSLTKAIEQCPRSLFGDKDKGTPPKYRRVFATVVKALLKDAGEKFDEKTVDLVADAVNMSSFQRAVADHRATITGKIDRKTGKYLPVEEKQPKKERGKPRVKAKGADGDEDDLGLGKSKKTSKKLKKAKKLKAAKAPEKAVKAPEKPAKALKKAPEKAASAAKPLPDKGASKIKTAAATKLDALAKARAAIAAKKAAKESPKTKSAEETVEI